MSLNGGASAVVLGASNDTSNFLLAMRLSSGTNPTSIGCSAKGVIWLQRPDLSNASSFARLASEIANQTNSIVVAPKFRSLDIPAPSVSGEDLARAVAELFQGNLVALNSSAIAAGFRGKLPEKFLLAGVGKGGGFATAVGAATVDNGAAEVLLGVVMFDGAAKGDQFSAGIAKLDSLGIPDYQITGPPSAANDWGRTTDLMAALKPGKFIGIETPLGANDAAITASVGWIEDIYGGFGPSDPEFGIYGNPNDGTYVPGQRFTIGGGWRLFSPSSHIRTSAAPAANRSRSTSSSPAEI